jgi:sortase A
LAGSANLKRKLGWLELGFYLGGAVLIAVFFFIRADSERLRQEGLEAFEQATAVQTAGSQNIPSELPGDPPRRYGDANPNQELWAEKRIRDYEESLSVVGEPPLAVLTIEHLDISVPVFNGTDEYNLNRGVGRIKGTAWIDTDGNLGIAGHRDGFFRPLKDIQIGDRMALQTAGGIVTYAVSSIEIVEPEDTSVLSPASERTLTLVTCYPFYYVGHAPKRFIVKATAEHSLAKTLKRGSI